MKATYTFILLAIFTSVSSAQWVEQTVPANSGLYSISAVDNSTVWICGADGVVMRTANGGNNWALTSSPNSSLDLYNIWAIDGQTAVVTGSSSSYTYVYKTFNAGGSWYQVFSQAGGFINAISGLRLTDEEHLFFCGNPVGGRWQLWRSSDAGSNWDSSGSLGGTGYIPQAGNETGYNNSLYVYRGNDLERRMWFGTNNARVYRNGFFFTVWDYVPTPGQLNGLSLLFVDTSRGFLGGSTGILYTSNGGDSWINWSNVIGTGSVKGFAVGYNYGELYYVRGSSIYKTTDAGASWITDYTATGTFYYMQKARMGYNIWAIWNSTGDNSGSISQFTSPIGIKTTNSEVPEAYNLYQNYPNPFNPSTRIKFDIPNSLSPLSERGVGGFVSLKIFDLLGREVAVLVNEQLHPGNYEVAWDAANYPSGVYLYKLTTGDFSESRKMILVK